MAQSKKKSKAKKTQKPAPIKGAAKSKARGKAKVAAKPKATAQRKSSGKNSGKAKVVSLSAARAKRGADSLADVVTPLDDRLVVRIERFTQTPGGLFIPSTVNEQSSRGRVVAVGRGHRDKKGRLRPMDVRVGDEVLIAAFAGTPMKIGAEDVVILRETDVLGIIQS